jgi:hypothetical protein
MTVDEFRELCQREWQQGSGEVAMLWLTEKSFRELASQAYVEEHGVLYKDEGNVSAAERIIYHPATQAPRQVNIRRNAIQNPVTKGMVTMKLSRDRDAADVWVKGRMETRILS